MFSSHSFSIFILLLCHIFSVLTADLKPWEKYYCNSDRLFRTPRILVCCYDADKGDGKPRISCAEFNDQNSWLKNCKIPLGTDKNPVAPREFITCCERLTFDRGVNYGHECSPPYERLRAPRATYPAESVDNNNPNPSFETPEWAHFLENTLEGIFLPEAARNKIDKESNCLPDDGNDKNCVENSNLNYKT